MPGPTEQQSETGTGGGGWFARLRGQLRGRSPFEGDIRPSRVSVLGRGPLPFPHPWNYTRPLEILDRFFRGADELEGSSRHNRYLDVPGFAPVLVTRDPGLIRAISAASSDKPGSFERDTMPSGGIARATGKNTLLYANGPAWKAQKKLANPAFARTTLFQPERFGAFEETFRKTAAERLALVRERVERGGEGVTVRLEPEIKAVMLELLVANFFGAEVEYTEIRDRYVPALDRVIDHIVRDTVLNKLGVPLGWVPALTPGIARTKRARADFEALTDLVIEARHRGAGQWGQFRSEAPDEALRSNIRVFLAGALEATTSYASWAIAHLARHPEAQERVYAEIRGIRDYTPEALAGAPQLGYVLDETLRLTPSLYFHPRRASVDTWVERPDGARLMIPAGTHILLDIWHANRHEDHWGVEPTGYPAEAFAPERWEGFAARGEGPNERLHFGFGHGPRFCPGKNLGQLEVALVVGACVKMFRFTAPEAPNPARAGVSTKPLDGVVAELRVRDPHEPDEAIAPQPTAPAGGCPFGHGRSG
ncbi:MAG: cytochrome P450 [Phycisphaeraceae bacterium]|nr:MAG: cytochrome P450 [Phycisphaeraceae bacterium]